MQEDKKSYLSKVADMLLETGALLMGAGANTGRIRVTINRIANSLGYQVELLITHRALMLSVIDDDGDFYSSKLKRTPPHGVNFKLVSGISRMSWKVEEEDWNLDQINEEIERLKTVSHYPRWLVLVLVSLAGSGFCRLFGGDWPDLALTFICTMAGLFVRQEAVKKSFNPYFCVVFASTTASLLSGLILKYNIGIHPEYTFATSVLFLVPGVPLINSFTDLIDGNILTGIVRGIIGMIIAFSIAVGLLIAKLIYQI